MSLIVEGTDARMAGAIERRETKFVGKAPPYRYVECPNCRASVPNKMVVLAEQRKLDANETWRHWGWKCPACSFGWQ